MSKSKILIIEDERSLSEILSYNLANEGFEVLTASDGIDGLRRAQNALPDLIVLDLMLPGIDGLQICRQLRSDPKTQGIRILMLTAKAEEVDEIVGFNMGADDYVAKPFKIKPLISRIKALLRRPSAEQSSSEVISVAGIEVDRTHHTAKLDGQEMQLTPTEFKMLWTMMRPSRPAVLAQRTARQRTRRGRQRSRTDHRRACPLAAAEARRQGPLGRDGSRHRLSLQGGVASWGRFATCPAANSQFVAMPFSSTLGRLMSGQVENLSHVNTLPASRNSALSTSDRRQATCRRISSLRRRIFRICSTKWPATTA